VFNNSSKLSVLLFVLALSLRLILPAIGFSGEVSDSPTYLSEATGLITGEGFINPQGHLTAFRPPVYPIFLAGILAISGGKIVGVQIIQAIFYSLLAPIIFNFLLPLVKEKRAFFGAFIFAVDPASIPFTALILTEAIGAVMIFLWYLSWGRISRSGRVLEYIWSGLLSGILILNTMITQLLQPLALILRMLFFRKEWLKIILSGMIFILPLTAWTVRNKTVLGESTAVKSAGFGFLLWATMNYDFPWLLNPYDKRGEYIFTQEKRVAKKFSPAEQHEIYFRKAVARFRAEPALCVYRVMKASLWSWIDVPGAMKTLDDYPRIRLLFRIINVSILLIALSGVPSAFKYREGRLAFGIILYFAFFHAPLFPIPRYYLPIRPLLAVLCSFAFMNKFKPQMNTNNTNHE